MIPEFRDDGFLPIGIHWAESWQEIEDRFAFNYYRYEKLQGLKQMLLHLKGCKCKTVYLDGSFTSIKDKPNDFDLCYDKEGVDFEYMAANYSVLLGRKYKQLQIYGGECYVSDHPVVTKGNQRMTILDLYQLIKDSDEPKGIVAIKLDML